MIDLEQDIVVSWNNFTKNHYIDLGYPFTKIGDNFTVKAKDLLNNSEAIVDVICDKCGKTFKRPYKDYNMAISRNDEKYYCKSCTTKRNNDKKLGSDYKDKRYEIFLNFCKDNNYTPISTKDCYINAKSKLYYKCQKHGEKYITIDSIKHGCICKECRSEIMSQNNRRDIQKVIEIVESNGNKLLNPDDYINTKVSNLRILCGKCGKEFTTSLSSQISSKGNCAKCGSKICASEIKLKPEEIDKRFNSKQKVLLNPEQYTGISDENLLFLCEKCGKPYYTSAEKYQNGQTYCRDCKKHSSEGEFIIQKFLDLHDINYEYQKWWPDCRNEKPLPFDFYLPDYNMVIEFDGIYHFSPIRGQERFEKQKLRDNIKNEYCSIKHIKLLRISFWNIKKLMIYQLWHQIWINYNNIEDIV